MRKRDSYHPLGKKTDTGIIPILMWKNSRKIIVLRKIGLSVSSISDLFDGVKTLPEELQENMDNLQKQMDELQGAMNLCRRMKDSEIELASMNADKYWNLVEEEEEQGNKFMTIAKDIVQTEKGVLASYFAFTSKSGEPTGSWLGVLRNAIICMGISGCILCLVRGSWNVKNLAVFNFIVEIYKPLI